MAFKFHFGSSLPVEMDDTILSDVGLDNATSNQSFNRNSSLDDQPEAAHALNQPLEVSLESLVSFRIFLFVRYTDTTIIS